MPHEKQKESSAKNLSPSHIETIESRIRKKSKNGPTTHLKYPWAARLIDSVARDLGVTTVKARDLVRCAIEKRMDLFRVQAPPNRLQEDVEAHLQKESRNIAARLLPMAGERRETETLKYILDHPEMLAFVEENSERLQIDPSMVRSIVNRAVARFLFVEQGRGHRTISPGPNAIQKGQMDIFATQLLESRINAPPRRRPLSPARVCSGAEVAIINLANRLDLPGNIVRDHITTWLKKKMEKDGLIQKGTKI